MKPKGPRKAGKVAQARLAIEYLPPDTLLEAPDNARTHSADQVRAIARSIEAGGFNSPILIDRQNYIVAGHGRLAAAKLVGLTELPVVRLEHLSEAQVQAYRLADNRLAERSSWDDRKVAQILKQLAESTLDFEIEATGFEQPEIDLRIQSLEPPEEIEPDEELVGPKGRTTSRLGDLWTLGHHRLLCGSALDMDAYGVLFGDERAAAVITDPPYNVRIDGHVGGKGRKRHREFPMASGEMNRDQFGAFLEQAFRQMAARCVDSAVLFSFMDWRHLDEILGAIRKIDHELINLCIWSKTNAGMGSLYRSAHELVFVFGKNGARHINNVQLGKFGRNRTNLWTYPGMNSFPRKGRARGLAYHPTVKPVALVADAIQDVTDRGMIVLDPFCGSGTILIAAHRTGRRAYAMELDPGYVDVAIERWQRVTGESAVHQSGKTFGEVVAERGDHGDA